MCGDIVADDQVVDWAISHPVVFTICDHELVLGRMDQHPRYSEVLYAAAECGDEYVARFARWHLSQMIGGSVDDSE